MYKKYDKNKFRVFFASKSTNGDFKSNFDEIFLIKELLIQN